MTRQEAAVLARAAKAAIAPPLLTRFWSKVDVGYGDQCWPWTAAVRRPDEGYGAFYLDRRHQPASRIAWQLTYGTPSLQVLHRCDNPKCCNPAHLFLGTNQDNNADKVAKNRHAHGEKAGTSKLKAEEVLAIRALNGKHTHEVLAAMFGITKGYVGEICRRESWRHLP